MQIITPAITRMISACERAEGVAERTGQVSVVEASDIGGELQPIASL
jgi:hypothetical protein